MKKKREGFEENQGEKIKVQKAWGRSNNGGSKVLDRNKLSQKEREKVIPY